MEKKQRHLELVVFNVSDERGSMRKKVTHERSWKVANKSIIVLGYFSAFFLESVSIKYIHNRLSNKCQPIKYSLILDSSYLNLLRTEHGQLRRRQLRDAAEHVPRRC